MAVYDAGGSWITEWLRSYLCAIDRSAQTRRTGQIHHIRLLEHPVCWVSNEDIDAAADQLLSKVHVSLLLAVFEYRLILHTNGTIKRFNGPCTIVASTIGGVVVQKVC